VNTHRRSLPALVTLFALVLHGCNLLAGTGEQPAQARPRRTPTPTSISTPTRTPTAIAT